MLERALGGDEIAFGNLVEPHRRELHVHCYRMLGSLHDADDLTQETLLRAWRHLRTFDGRGPLRAWLYKIATNVCLRAMAKRERRVLPQDYLPAGDITRPASRPLVEDVWLDPYPDSILDQRWEPGPEARYELRESVRLAFLAALQLLPGRQRAVLILRDVIGWSAAEVAELLESSVASVNSALQRARATVEQRVTLASDESRPQPSDPYQNTLLDRFVRAWEDADVAAIVSMLKEDAILSMPPYAAWYRGREAIGTFLITQPFADLGPLRLVRADANGCPAFAVYQRTDAGTLDAVGIMLFDIQDGLVQEIVGYPVPELLGRFGLPESMPAEPTAR